LKAIKDPNPNYLKEGREASKGEKANAVVVQKETAAVTEKKGGTSGNRKRPRPQAAHVVAGSTDWKDNIKCFWCGKVGHPAQECKSFSCQNPSGAVPGCTNSRTGRYCNSCADIFFQKIAAKKAERNSGNGPLSSSEASELLGI
jgi:hypothetical protein